MTDRIRTLTVILDRDMRDDDVEHVKNAISMVKLVVDVQNGDVVNSDAAVARIELRQGLIRDLCDILSAYSLGDERSRELGELLVKWRARR